MHLDKTCGGKSGYKTSDVFVATPADLHCFEYLRQQIKPNCRSSITHGVEIPIHLSVPAKR